MGAWNGNDIVAGQRGGTAARWRRAAVAAAALAVPLAGAGIAAAPASAAAGGPAASRLAAASARLTASRTSVTFGTPVTFTVRMRPSAATGSVAFADRLSSGPNKGRVVTLGRVTLSGGTAALTAVLPAFNTNTVTAAYSGDATYRAVRSRPVRVRVAAYRGEVLISEFRLSGPRGAGDQYVELYNAGAPVSLAGFRLSSRPGAHRVTIPAGAPVLPTGGAYLITGRRYSLSGVAHSDLVASLGSAGLRVTAPDRSATETDAVGTAAAGSGFHFGTPLPALPGTPTDQYAWVRVELGGQPGNTRSNAADFRLVSTTGRPISGPQCRRRCLAPALPGCRQRLYGRTRTLCPALGSPSPRGTRSPDQDNKFLQSALLDPAKAETAAPNAVYVQATRTKPGLLTIRRTITNSSAVTIRTAEARITSLSELNGAPEPGVATQPPDPARLRDIDPKAHTSTITITGGKVIKVEDLTLDRPDTSRPGGGLDTTLKIPLLGGLAPGASVSIAFSFAVDRPGAYWFGYDVDALPALREGPLAAAPAAAASPVPAPGTGLAPGTPSPYAGGYGILP